MGAIPDFVFEMIHDGAIVSAYSAISKSLASASADIGLPIGEVRKQFYQRYPQWAPTREVNAPTRSDH